MKLLVVEADEAAAAGLRRALREHGHVADVCADAANALHLALEGTQDLLILSDRLHGASALHVLAELRSRRSTPVLVLGDNADADERARVLRMGADDYLVRPFALAELLARVHALWRRQAARLDTASRVTIRDLELDLLRRQARRQGRLLPLTAQEFKLLSVLALHQGTVLSRSALRDLLWDDGFESDTNVVDVAVRRLRAKVDRPFAVKLLRTVRGAGYVLDEPVA